MNEHTRTIKAPRSHTVRITVPRGRTHEWSPNPTIARRSVWVRRERMARIFHKVEARKRANSHEWRRVGARRRLCGTAIIIVSLSSFSRSSRSSSNVCVCMLTSFVRSFVRSPLGKTISSLYLESTLYSHARMTYRSQTLRHRMYYISGCESAWSTVIHIVFIND